MEYLENPSNHSLSTLVWGDSNGCIYYLRFFDLASTCLLAAKNVGQGQLPLNQILTGNIMSMKCQKFQFQFKDWVQNIKLFYNNEVNCHSLS